MSNIQVEVTESIMTIKMNRPKQKNALTKEMYLEMAKALQSAEEQASVVVITGEGCFTAGNDISEFADKSTETDVDISAQSQFMRALTDCPLPVVAAVDELAIGIGTTMLLHCDFVFCTPDTRFQLPFINLALTPEFGASYLLPKIMGHRLAADLLMLGDKFDVETAYQLGLVNDVEEPGLLMQRVYTVATRLTEKPQRALRKTKALMKTDRDVVQEHIDDELDEFVLHLKTEEAQEAFNAFAQKRKPDFTKFK